MGNHVRTRGHSRNRRWSCGSHTVRVGAGSRLRGPQRGGQLRDELGRDRRTAARRGMDRTRERTSRSRRLARADGQGGRTRGPHPGGTRPPRHRGRRSLARRTGRGVRTRGAVAFRHFGPLPARPRDRTGVRRYGRPAARDRVPRREAPPGIEGRVADVGARDRTPPGPRRGQPRPVDARRTRTHRADPADPRARAHLLTGKPATALALCRKCDWFSIRSPAASSTPC